ncbi:MAG: hypothetical protein GKS07_02290 [Nitrosopumilus sp.]|nr:MAG: hypothetical protein GKS07_02290 [Nitrosopumilus sp.]
MIKTISQLKKTKKKILILHYACTSLNTTPVIITNISVRDYSLNQTFSFGFDKYKNEFTLLHAFLAYMKKQSNYLLLTWNQKSSTYGIQHIEERCAQNNLLDKFSINYDSIVDFDDLLTAKYGPGYAPNPKLEHLARLNDITLLSFVKGIQEISLFKVKQYKRIENSTNRKVAIMAHISRYAMNDELLIKREPTENINLLKKFHHKQLFATKKSTTKILEETFQKIKTAVENRPGLYYFVWADLSDSTKSSEKLSPEEFSKKINDFIDITKYSIPPDLNNVGYFVKDIGDASFLLFNNFLDILKWKNILDDKCNQYNNKIKSKEHIINYKVIVHLGEIFFDKQKDPKTVTLNQISKIEKIFRKNQFGITENVRMVISSRINSGQIKVRKIPTKLIGTKSKEPLWQITKYKI